MRSYKLHWAQYLAKKIQEDGKSIAHFFLPEFCPNIARICCMGISLGA